MTCIHVPVGRGYDVLVQPGLLDGAGEQIARVSRAATVAVISDDTVFPLYGERVCESLRRAGFRTVSFAFPAGEQHKNLTTYASILNFLAEQRLSRSDLLVALGGGVTGDMAGFAASTYLRGIPFVQIPTTLLAAVDSSVGGKTAVDLPAGKNLVGTFCQPALVLCDPQVLDTLPHAQYRDGCAEVIKYGLMGNAEFFEQLERVPASEQREHVIATCIAMKRDLVCEDEFDVGARRLLNLGHSIGHAVEACSDFAIPHGSAVAIGMAHITRAAVKRGICPPEVLPRVLNILKQYDLPTQAPYPLERLYQASLADKKIANGKMHLVVPEGLGRCRIQPVSGEEMRQWMRDGGIQ